MSNKKVDFHFFFLFFSAQKFQGTSKLLRSGDAEKFWRLYRRLLQTWYMDDVRVRRQVILNSKDPLKVS
jgi:hypothetical protein